MATHTAQALTTHPAPAGEGRAVRADGTRRRGRQAVRAVWPRAAAAARERDRGDEALVATDRRGIVVYWNGAAEALTGWAAADVLGRPLSALRAPGVQGELAAAVEALLRAGLSWSGEIACARRGAAPLLLYLMAEPLRAADGTALGVLACARDAFGRREEERRLRNAELRFRTLVEHFPAVAYVEHPEGGGDAYMSPQIEQLTGYTVEEWTSAPDFWLSVTHPDDRGRVLAEIARTDATGEPYAMEYRYIHRDGHIVWTRNEAVLTRDDDGPSYWQGVITDITERKQLEELLEHQALHDALTGLPNRTLLLDRLEQALAIGRRQPARVAVLFIDVDNFKGVNDSLGHAAGDELLREAAWRLRSCLRAGDTAARFGGDEFAVVAPGMDDEPGLLALAERISAALRAPFVLGAHTIAVTPSIGVTVSRSPNDEPDDLLQRADLAMYRAKASGKDRWVVF